MPDSDDSSSLFIGLMSGTSMDGIDAALIEFGDHTCQVLASIASDYPADLRDQLLQVASKPSGCTVDVVGQLDQWVGECFRDAALRLLSKARADAQTITAVGSHGQTIRHQPNAARPFTLQIGDPNIIAAGTGITTVADFRRRDVALGGEGAPLAPAFHRWLFSDPEHNRAVLNIGGIANITLLPAGGETVTGFDTGPGNTLLDGWIRSNLDKPFDENGAWAGSGSVSQALLELMAYDEYFDLPPPKSTGFEYFNLDWVRSRISSCKDGNISAADVQATLSALSAQSIAQSILKFAPDTNEVLVCGGGIHNSDLLHRLRNHLPNAQIDSTESYGLHPDWVEAAAFAWLAKRCIEGKPGNLPTVTGAARPSVLGAVYLGHSSGGS